FRHIRFRKQHEMTDKAVKAKEESDEKKNGAEREDVCRDFLKNICNRGSRCKFYHPEEVERERAQKSSGSKQEFNFCIDFQNRGCQRDNCRFVHAHRDDVERYKSTGEVTLNLARAIAAVHTGDTINGIPFCKEFQTGICTRGASRCRYWHVNVEEERDRRRRQQRGLPPLGPAHLRAAGAVPALPPPYGFSSPYGANAASRRPIPYGGGGEAYDAMIATAGAKRARYDVSATEAANQDYARELERKNAELAKENEGLKRELQRERERYEDLYALFRQRGTTAQPTPVPGPDPVASGNFGSVTTSYGAPPGAGSNSASFYQSSVQTNWTSAASRSHWTQ
uniref:C3H1-type domain-containing protein n=1 Tax=Parascaris univalens TaxID=6257 RepID=A0A915AFF4_PARUN